jgi:hypothetical protein
MGMQMPRTNTPSTGRYSLTGIGKSLPLHENNLLMKNVSSFPQKGIYLLPKMNTRFVQNEYSLSAK